MKTFLCESPSEKSVILNLLHFRKMPKGHGVALIGFAIWRFSRVQFIKKKKIHAYATLRLCKKHLFGPWTRRYYFS